MEEIASGQKRENSQSKALAGKKVILIFFASLLLGLDLQIFLFERIKSRSLNISVYKIEVRDSLTQFILTQFVFGFIEWTCHNLNVIQLISSLIKFITLQNFT